MFEFHANVVCRVPAPRQNITETLSFRFDVLHLLQIKAMHCHLTHIIVAHHLYTVYVKATV